ncbi:putative mediator of RNA polymerase II transcription subunit 24 isoform X1 [Prorops nasuta]|uniref:putative mediator of RNA polymerase II transcription subunit 24 isoform X1 n=1 Tax=Prorops nasuta TaxID=863751 RepID=UPI0034CE5460
MPTIPKRRKLNKPVILTKRPARLINLREIKSYKLLCEKLKNNNNHLAKALAKEKQEVHLLFTQNVALNSQVQDLGIACNKRDNIILNVLNNSNQVLSMIVSMTEYITNTIATCQEIVRSSDFHALQEYHTPETRRESVRRLSTKSPAKGVVKPMVSGHTITKPTINLSRVNVQSGNSQLSLSTIEESSLDSNENLTNISTRSPMQNQSSQQLGFEIRRACRLPERITTSSPRGNDEDERRLSRRKSKNRYSGNILERRSMSKTNRSSRSFEERQSIGKESIVRSPLVRLTDVSKTLSNSQNVSVRRVIKMKSVVGSSPEGKVSKGDPVPEMNLSNKLNKSDSTDENRMLENSINKNNINSPRKSKHINKQRNTNLSVNKNSLLEDDPLEGPSWLYSNSELKQKSNKRKKNSSSFANDKLEGIDSFYSNSRCKRNTKMQENSNLLINDDLPSPNNPLKTLKGSNHNSELKKGTCTLESDNVLLNHDSSLEGNPLEGPSYLNHNSKSSSRSKNSDSDCSNGEISFQMQLPINNMENEETDLENDCFVKPIAPNRCDGDDDLTMKWNFITKRGMDAESIDDDDFTLMCRKEPPRRFNFHDLRMPVLEASMLNVQTTEEEEPEVTTTVSNINHRYHVSHVIDGTLNISDCETVKMPRLSEIIKLENCFSEQDNCLNTEGDQQPNKKLKKTKQSLSDRDPKSATVVLQKLNETGIKRSVSTASSVFSQSMLSNNSSFDASNDIDGLSTKDRPRRRKAPLNLKEPSLVRKLRRG